MNNILMILFLVLNFNFSQDMPVWLEAQLSDDNQDIVLNEIEDLIDQKLDFKSLKFSELKDHLFFVPDTILRAYLNNKLSDDEFDFIAQFDRQNYRFENKNYSLYRISSKDDDQTDYLGNSAILKSYHSLTYQNYLINYSQLKLKHEAYFTHNFFRFLYSKRPLTIAAGNLSLKGFNPLIFSTPYGKRFVAGQNIFYTMRARTGAQSSIIKQNHLTGIFASYNLSHFEISMAYGQQHYLVSFKEDHFESFNVYFPMQRQSSIDSRTKIQETNLIIKAVIRPWENYTASIDYLNCRLSQPYHKVGDYKINELNKSSYLALHQTYRFDESIMSFNHAIQFGRKSASEIKLKFSNISFAWFKYNYQYLNPHSTAFMDGSAFARNQSGYFLQYKQKLSSALNIYLSLKNSRDLESDDFEEFPAKTVKFEHGLNMRLQDHRLFLIHSKSTVDKLKLIHHYSINSKHNIDHQHSFYDHSSYFGQIKYSFHSLRLGFAYTKSGDGITTYQYGLPREFLTNYFRGEHTLLFAKIRFNLNDKLKINFSSQVKKELKSSENLKLNTGLSISYDF